jgi:hypothetical protein
VAYSSQYIYICMGSSTLIYHAAIVGNQIKSPISGVTITPCQPDTCDACCYE